ncbi:hypothetical protein V1264_006334 [Littorina saxatilis]
MVTSLCAQLIQSQLPAVSWASDPAFVSVQPSSSAADLKMEPSSLMDCAALCSTKTWCSSFFYNRLQNRCLVFKGVYFDKRGLPSTAGAEYYLIASDRCPCQDGFYLGRPDNLCFFYLRENKTYNGSKELCQANRGRLAILDTLSKNELVVLNMQLNNADVGAIVFLGARRHGEDFKWDNDNMVAAHNGSIQSFWAGNEPNTESCLVLKYSTQNLRINWHDIGCGRQGSGVLCEYQHATN